MSESDRRAREHRENLLVCEIERLRAEIVTLKRKRDAALALVIEQANDEGLWFVARTAPEAYLQQELRRLHTAMENPNE